MMIMAINMRLSFLAFSIVLAMGLIPQRAEARLYTPACVVAEAAGPALRLYSLVSQCSGAVQTNLVKAVQAVSNGNSAKAAALGGTLSVESSCGLASASETSNCNGCNACYNLQSTRSSASGATQFIDETYYDPKRGTGVVKKGTPTSNAMIQQLGGCGSSARNPTKGSLLDAQRTQSGYLVGQYEQFLKALCNDTAKNNKDYFTSMIGPSVLLGDVYKTSFNQNYLNDVTVQSTIASTGANAYAVSLYANHNLGPGNSAKFFAALKSNPSALISDIGLINQNNVINGNKSLYCQKATGPCTPVTLAQVAKNMNNTMFNKSCSRNFLSSIGVSANQAPVLAGANTGTCGVDLTCGISGAAALAEIMAAGGVAGDIIGTSCLQTGINCTNAEAIEP